MTAPDWVQVGSACVLAVTAIFILLQALFSRRLVVATIASFVEGNVQLSLVPYDSTGALNLRVYNAGASAANDVQVEFPCGLLRTTSSRIENLVESGQVPLELGSLGPGEKREWFLMNTSDALFAELPRFLPYEASYLVATRRKRKRTSGRFDLHSYKGSLLRAYVGLGDLEKALKDCTAALILISKGVQPAPASVDTPKGTDVTTSDS